MKLHRFSSLSLQIVLVVLLPLAAAAIGISIYSQTLHHQAMQEMVGQRDLRTVKVMADLLGARLGQAQASLEDRTAGSGTDFPARFELDPSGRWVGLPGADPDLAPQALALLSSLHTASTGGFHFLSQGSDPVRWALVIAPPGAVRQRAGVFDLQAQLQGMVAGLEQPGLLSVALYDSTHQLWVAAGRAPADEHSLYHPGILAGLEGESGVLYPQHSGTGVHSSAHVIAYTPVGTTGWVLVLDEAWEDVSSGLLERTQQAPLILVPFILLAVGALLLILRQVVLPLQRLETQAEALGKGDFNAMAGPVGRLSEIRSLQERMRSMALNLRQARLDLQDYIGAMTRGIEDERRRMARDLHDQPLQSLIAVKHQLYALPGAGGAELAGRLQGVIDDLRRLVRGLRPGTLEDLGLGTALQGLCQEFEAEVHTPVAFHPSGAEERFPAEVELAFYRIAQEALANVRRHAGQAQASLQLEYAPGRLAMRVSDDGAGFTLPERVERLAGSGHYGLMGILERGALIGAQVTLSSTPGKGTTVTVEYPKPAGGPTA